jgi:hypothetical protein
MLRNLPCEAAKVLTRTVNPERRRIILFEQYEF